MAKISFDKLQVIIANIGGPGQLSTIIVTWDLIPVHSGLDNVTFRVERSQSPQFENPDEITVLASGIAAQSGLHAYSFTDITPDLINFWRRYFYRVVAVREPPGEAVEEFPSKIQTWYQEARPYEIDIIDRHNLLLEQFTGQPCFAFIERTTEGTRCSCWDPSLRRSCSSNCPLCLTTGWQMPYLDPILFYADFNPDAKMAQIVAFGEIQAHQKQCWFSAFPVLKPGDLIYQCKVGIIWRIARMNPIEPQGVNIQQVAVINALGRDEVEYSKVRVPEELVVSTVRTWQAGREGRYF